MWPQISNKFFTCPKKVAKFWNGVVTTDGVVASWHLEKATTTATTKATKKIN
jgi:hypothetical protein